MVPIHKGCPTSLSLKRAEGEGCDSTFHMQVSHQLKKNPTNPFNTVWKSPWATFTPMFNSQEGWFHGAVAWAPGWTTRLPPRTTLGSLMATSQLSHLGLSKHLDAFASRSFI
ncbi:hypothetical protein HanRHA438_Chr17g0811231 [Helianthus annuus]|nr:hypothetical protein HanIR_Chr17g0868861 [Helianthus annuus]KAJ0826160.1 hypothetical protein HanRHA438_Chr17g0811231 [Helianthus annuus]